MKSTSPVPCCGLRAVWFSLAALGALTLPSFAKDELKIAREGATVNLSWTLPDGLKYLEVVRDTDADPKGRTRVKILRGDVRAYTDTAPDAAADFFYWIKYTTADGKTENLGPVKAALPKAKPVEKPKPAKNAR